MSTARTDIAVSTAEQIAALLATQLTNDDEAVGLARAQWVIKTFVAALRTQQPPRRGRPRGKTGEAK